MTAFHLVIKEIAHRKLNFVLSVVGVVVAVTLFVFFYSASESSRKETARLMRNIGLNLRIIPKETDMNRFFATGFSNETMSEEYIQRLASQRGLNFTHLLPTLHRKTAWRDREIILTGLAPEVCPPDRQKPSMSFEIEPGTVYLGHQIAQSLGLKKGDTVEVLGKDLTVVRCLKETGTDDDIRVYVNLKDAQAMLDLPGRINEIRALNCLCVDAGQNPLAALREQLEKILPDARILQMRAIADAREKQRRMIERYLAFLLPFVLVVSVAWVGVLAMLNVRDRQNEIGILRAIGHGTGRIASLFLGKAVVVGVVGGVIGFAVGTGLALGVGPEIFKVTAKAIKPMWSLLGWSILGAAGFAAVASFIPTTVAITQDPATILSQE